jgi:DNA-binding transcriptional MerR regulator
VEQEFSIRDLEQFSGIKAHTIRMWEQRYGLLTPRRTATNIRYYTGEDLKKLLCVSLLVDHGHRISTVAQLGPARLAESVGKLAEEDDAAAREALLKVAMLAFDEAVRVVQGWIAARPERAAQTLLIMARTGTRSQHILPSDMQATI